MFSVYEVDESGEVPKRFDSKTGKEIHPKPVLHMGLKKVKACLDQIEEMRKFVMDNE